MERPIFKPPGTPIEELDTPALVVDLAALEHNLETVHSYFRERPAKLRPHVEAHRCPAIAHKQLAAGGTAGGICVNTVGQSELFAKSGFDDVFIANQVVTPQKIRRLCALAHHARVSVTVDNPKNAKALSEAASAAGVTIDAVVEINARSDRTGIEPGKQAVGLAKTLAKSSGLRFAGFTTYEGAPPDEDPEASAQGSRRVVQRLLDTREMAEKAGLEVHTASAGGTHNYEVVGDMAGVTEVIAGSYALMDGRYRPFQPQLRPAARVLAVVTSRPEAGVAILDTGQKAIGSDGGLPSVDGGLNARVGSLSAEHGSLQLLDESAEWLKPGDKVWLIPWDIGTCANLYDYAHAARDGRLEVIWDIGARGLYR